MARNRFQYFIPRNIEFSVKEQLLTLRFVWTSEKLDPNDKGMHVYKKYIEIVEKYGDNILLQHGRQIISRPSLSDRQMISTYCVLSDERSWSSENVKISLHWVNIERASTMFSKQTLITPRWPLDILQTKWRNLFITLFNILRGNGYLVRLEARTATACICTSVCCSTYS